MIGPLIFSLLAAVAFGLGGYQYYKIYQNISLGTDAKPSASPLLGLKNTFLVAFGQQKMFKRMVPAVMHLFIYVAFLFTQIELLEIMVDGFTGSHRFFLPYLGGFYTFLINFIEILSVLAFVGTIVFLYRRNMLKLPRFFSKEMDGWPRLDANLILLGELLLLFGIFSMNGADSVLQKIDPSHYPDTGPLLISGMIGPYLIEPVLNLVGPAWNFIVSLGFPVGAGVGEGMSVFLLQIVERVGWWLHITVVFAFLLYLPFSKHLHIMLAFPNTYFANQSPNGEMSNMPEIMDEVKMMLGLSDGEPDMNAELPEFGANDVNKLPWQNILGAFTCTECGRCTSVCPANITGKKLSPRKIMMDIRDRATEMGDKIRSGNTDYCKDAEKPLTQDNFDDGKSLFDYITREEIHACTTCNACVEACPVLINPMENILELRRYEILTESAGPGDWVPMFTAIENSGSVWQIPDDRDKWAKELEL